MATSMWMVQNGQWKVFAKDRADAITFRRMFAELKHGRVTHVLQMRPSEVEYGKLYGR